MNPSAEHLNQLLPQTQCRECGYSGCLPYAEALVNGEAAINLCAPGGNTVMNDLAKQLNRPPLAPVRIQAPQLAKIDEDACIGCTACIKACPVDAIFGATKLMHTIIAEECTGCALCLPPCPVDCIQLYPAEADHLPQARYLTKQTDARFAAAEHARTRFEQRNHRLARNEAERQAHLAERESRVRPIPTTQAAPAAAPAFNPSDLIAQAMSRAATQNTQRSTPSNQTAFKEQQIKQAQERAAYRRALRDVQCGDEAKQAAAIEFLRAYKAAQEAAANNSLES